MSVIVKTSTGNCDFILEQEYPDEITAAAPAEEGKKISDATFLNVKVFNVKYKIKQAIDVGTNTKPSLDWNVFYSSDGVPVFTMEK